MLKRKRTLREMSENELEAVTKVFSPGRFFQKHSKLDLQEEIIHWILENGLRIDHEFTLLEMDDGSYGILTDENGCSCCQKSVLSDANQSAEEEVVKKRSENSSQAEMSGSIVVEEISQIKSETNLSFTAQYDSKSAIVGMQPLPTSLSFNDSITRIDEGLRINSEKNTKQQKGGLSQFCAELGSCCISLFSSC
ncbi:hypothetical protein LOAG_01030 [Loa loa]|uniref:Uncharacterized protein n=2 Tax=Loa loa TaxID=7209 RepID=A0A1S0U9T2_LOALO|nr:hypothetical protein LOAG_01030 [Loa loa]EFO27459.2 hypothetical protein LOAG_01030 [Loa loa]